MQGTKSKTSESSPSQHQIAISSTSRKLDAFISFPTQPATVKEHASPQSGIPSQELELMHHYATSTYTTLSNGTAQNEVWQHIVPREALHHAFLMHGILAVSALHLAHLRPSSSQYYINIAMHHYTLAVEHFRPILEEITPTNATAVFIFSSLLACISFAIPQESPETTALPFTPLDTLQKIINIFTLERGVQTVLEACWAWVKNGSIEPLMVHIPTEPENDLRDDEEQALKSLESRIGRESRSEELKTEALKALQLLRAIHPFNALPTEQMSFIMAWPVLVSSTFFTAICERQPVAIAILGYYGAVLHGLVGVWWVGDKGLRLVMACTDLLGPRWDECMRWAKCRVGLCGNPALGADGKF
ncbi:hypothetical protein BGZ60DRAFT_427880 [Tricladium varicosporioides]|nr:hypothetical protein BGZ60DRAFT_427880 [Hymenoscyphus varicosporioides]